MVGLKMLSRRQALSGSAALIGTLASGALAMGRAKAAPGFHGSQRVPYGSCVAFGPLQNEPDYRGALTAYCQQLTPEWGFNWDYVQPAPSQFNFDFADSVLAFAQANDMTMRGHALVWYASLPDWAKDIRGAAEAESALTSHVETLVSRYRGKVKTWHVVNEPLEDPKGGSAASLRQSVWMQNLGEKYIDRAFHLAHQADPAAELLINEYGIESLDEGSTPKRQALLKLVKDLLGRGVPLHGIGLQGHLLDKYEIDTSGTHDFVSEIRSLGLSVHITELDVVDDSLPGAIPARDAVVAARAYDFLDAVFAAARPSMVGTWGITDRHTWVPMYHKRADGLINRPLPLDDHYRPTPLWSVINYFCQQIA